MFGQCTSSNPSRGCGLWGKGQPDASDTDADSDTNAQCGLMMARYVYFIFQLQDLMCRLASLYKKNMVLLFSINNMLQKIKNTHSHSTPGGTPGRRRSLMTPSAALLVLLSASTTTQRPRSGLNYSDVLDMFCNL